MTTWGTITAGRMTLRETYEIANQASGQVTLAGQESTPPLTYTELRQRYEDTLGLNGYLIPIQFSNKTDRNGYYGVTDVQVGMTDWTVAATEQAGAFAWQATLVYAGPDNAVDFESRMTGVARLNDFAFTGERWHAPPIGHYAYYTGSTPPSSTMTRSTEDGTITVYRGVPASINPRWGCPVGSYMSGRARIKLAAVERTGTNLTAAASAWSMSNGMVNITPGTSGTFTIGAWGGAAYENKEWNVTVGATGAPEITTWDGIAVIRNDPEMCTIRLVKTKSPNGRSMLDLSLRRGSRFVEGYLQTDSSTTLAVWRDTTENGTAPASAGYVTATGNDSDGNRYIVGTARTFTAQTTQGGLHKTSTTTLDFFIGAVFNGGSAVTGDQAADLRNQYIAALAETTAVVRR